MGEYAGVMGGTALLLAEHDDQITMPQRVSSVLPTA